MRRNNRSVSALYVHVPFCSGKCFYCDFYSIASPKEDTILGWHRGILKELTRLYDESFANDVVIKPLQTIYLGGGTPSFVPPSLIFSILEHARVLFSFADDCDITIEANPESIRQEALLHWREAGINRISFGLQSSSDRLLRLIGRRHTSKDAQHAILSAESAGFSHIAVDLMTGLPDQTIQDVKESLDFITELPIDHLSSYALDIVPGTPFHAMWEEEPERFPSDEEEREMTQQVICRMNDLGFLHYEISNFAKPGAESRHNLSYWRGESYLGAGPSAASFMAGIRRKNPPSVTEWLQQVDRPDLGPYSDRTIEEIIDEQAARIETMILGLRIMEGVSFDHFYQRHGVHMDELFGDIFQKLEQQGLIKRDKRGVRLSEKGLDFADAVVREFL